MQTSRSEIIAPVRGFVEEKFLYVHPNFHLADVDPLPDRGVIDSMSIVETIAFIESEFGVNAREEEISDAISGLLQKSHVLSARSGLSSQPSAPQPANFSVHSFD